MSRSSPQLTNPAAHFWEWRRGELSYYDKELQKSIPAKLPFEFLVLDELATITGFCEPDESGYWSNEVVSVAREEFTVRTKRGIKQIGLYKDLTDVRAHGAKYTKSIYIAEKSGGGYVISNIKASGAALTAWIELTSKYKVMNGKIRLTGSTEAKKGATTYQIPTFEYTSATPAENEAAIELDKDLQDYLRQYFAAANAEHESRVDVVDGIDPDLGLATPEQQADFEARKKAKFDKPDSSQDVYNQVAANDYPDDDLPPLSDDDIPPEFR